MLGEYNKILITGGAGFIGSHLREALLNLKKEVVVFDNLSTGSQDNIPKGVTFIKGDIGNPKEVLEAMRGIDLVFHTAANANGTISVTNPRFDFEMNNLGTFNVLDAIRQLPVKRVVCISSAAVYGRPQSVPMDEHHPTTPFIPYGASKLNGETYCSVFFKTYQLPVVIARPYAVYGPRENPKTALAEISRYVRWHLSNQPIKIVGGNVDQKTRDFIYVSDLVNGLLLLAERAPLGEVFNIGSGQEIPMREVIEVLESLSGKKARIENIEAVREDTYRFVADISKIRSLGFHPETSLKDGMRQVIEYVQQHPGPPQGQTIFTPKQAFKE